MANTSSSLDLSSSSSYAPTADPDVIQFASAESCGRTRRTRKEYMKKMNNTEAVPENFAMSHDVDKVPAEHATPADLEPRKAQAAM
ncbi:hypothetical protein V6N13_024982 [Hibiscus sabdariffa]|uniref:Uncharacterized protein n=2 Tax=Hibiscus sabdariffa TaxID=183260 RepID=A0ABR2NIT8_9ROSI